MIDNAIDLWGPGSLDEIADVLLSVYPDAKPVAEHEWLVGGPVWFDANSAEHRKPLLPDEGEYWVDVTADDPERLHEVTRKLAAKLIADTDWRVLVDTYDGTLIPSRPPAADS